MPKILFFHSQQLCLFEILPNPYIFPQFETAKLQVWDFSPNLATLFVLFCSVSFPEWCGTHWRAKFGEPYHNEKRIICQLRLG